MSREIRFRAWDRKERLMWPWDEMNADTKHMQVGGIQDFFEDLNLIFMQYTDQLDKNGKPIYESDIVRQSHPEQDTEMRLVVWKGSQFTLDYSTQDLQTLMDIGHEFEVIGNRYETPELLKGEL